jgi:hypothetical protein
MWFMAKREWKDLSLRQRRAIVLGSVIQVGLLVAALVDIHRRPEEEIWCNKWLWTLASFVNFVGPISYFSFGRKR